MAVYEKYMMFMMKYVCCCV